MQGGRSIRMNLQNNIREVVFGLEDSLVSTLGAITGIAAGTESTYVVILSGVVLIFVEALSMAAGSYLSSKSADEAMKSSNLQGTPSRLVAMRAGVIMGVFYLAGGVFPIAPYFLLSVHDAILPSVIITVILLFLLGIWKGIVTKTSKVRSAIEMSTVSMTAAVLGYLIGRAVAVFFGVAVV